MLSGALVSWPSDMPLATRQLRDPDPGIRRVAVMDLVDSPEEEAVQLLLEALGDSDELVRMEAAKVIDELDPQDMLDALVEESMAMLGVRSVHAWKCISIIE